MIITTDIKTGIFIFVKKNKYPSLRDLISEEWPHLKITNALLSLLLGKSVNFNLDLSKERAVFSENNSNFLSINFSSSTLIKIDGEITSLLDALLMAIRISEIDSYEWINFPPHIRQSKISNALICANVDEEEYNRARALWISQ